jgi:hypothetical protein
MSRKVFGVSWDDIVSLYGRWRKNPVFCLWRYLFVAIVGVAINEISERRWPVILLVMLGFGLVFSIIITDYEQSKQGKKIWTIFRPWFLLVVFAASSMVTQWHKTVQSNSILQHTNNFYLKQISDSKKYYVGTLTALTNKLTADENLLSYEHRSSQLGLWASAEYQHAHYPQSLELFGLAFEADQTVPGTPPSDRLKLTYWPIVSADILLTNQTPGAATNVELFGQSLKDMLSESLSSASNQANWQYEINDLWYIRRHIPTNAIPSVDNTIDQIVNAQHSLTNSPVH